jgi:hypothetical protein
VAASRSEMLSTRKVPFPATCVSGMEFSLGILPSISGMQCPCWSIFGYPSMASMRSSNRSEMKCSGRSASSCTSSIRYPLRSPSIRCDSDYEAFADRLVFASHHSAGTPMLMQYLRRPCRSGTPRRRYKRLKMFLMVCSLVRIWAAISLFL